MNKERKALKIIIAGGGTGGHLFPGIAIAEDFLEVNKENNIMFVGTTHGIENRVIPQEGFPFLPITAYGLFGKSITAQLKGLVTMVIGTFQSAMIIFRKKPDIIIGVGGYASAPMLMAATLLRKRFMIQEQNSIPGFVNKFFGKFADTVFISFEGAKDFFSEIKGKVIDCGNPIRKTEVSEEIKSEFKKTKKFKILVFGGSQGAHAINKLLADMLPYFEKVKEQVFILHQTGEKDFEETKNIYEKSGVEAEVKPFIDKLHSYYSHADLIISRSGASTIAELTNYGKASILIPFPFAVKNHQELNAREIEKEGGAIVFNEKEANKETIARLILDFIKNPVTLEEMNKNAARLGKGNAARTIVEHCYKTLSS